MWVDFHRLTVMDRLDVDKLWIQSIRLLELSVVHRTFPPALIKCAIDSELDNKLSLSQSTSSRTRLARTVGVSIRVLLFEGLYFKVRNFLFESLG